MISRLMFLGIGLFFIIYILLIVRNKNFSESKSLFWIFGGIIILILSIFPNLIKQFAFYIGIEYGPSALFLLAIVILVYIVFRQDQEISDLNEKVKELAQLVALLKKESETDK